MTLNELDWEKGKKGWDCGWQVGAWGFRWDTGLGLLKIADAENAECYEYDVVKVLEYG